MRGIAAIFVIKAQLMREQTAGEPAKKERITTGTARELLRKEGMDVSAEEANEILELLNVLARLEVEGHLKRRT